MMVMTASARRHVFLHLLILIVAINLAMAKKATTFDRLKRAIKDKDSGGDDGK